MKTTPPMDVHAYYRRITDLDIGGIARELLAGRVTDDARETLHCDCPNHHSQSHRSLHVSIEKQAWYCFGCGVGGDVLQLVEFIHSGTVTRGQSGRMPASHRDARDFLAARAGLPTLSQAGKSTEELAEAEEAHRLTLRVRDALTALADIYHQRLLANPEVLAWFREKYRIGDDMIARLKIGFADNSEPSPARQLIDGAGEFTMRELTATSAFRPTAQDGIVPFFDGRIVFPYWSRGQVAFMIGRRTPWTPDVTWEKSKYKKLSVRNDRNNNHVAPCIQNDLLYNEDALLTRPERLIITEGVTDCISLMERGFPVVSPVTVQIREADWERLLPKLAGVKTVFICQDNEVSEAGMNGALRTARMLAENGILTRVAVLPLDEKQRVARAALARLSFSADQADTLLADAKIDVNEFFAAGKAGADFEAILSAAQTPLEMAISRLSPETPDAQLNGLIEPILAEIGGLDPIEENRHLKLIQARIGKNRLPVNTLRKQLKVVEIRGPLHKRRGGRGGPKRDVASGEGDIPAIQVNNRQLRDVATDAWQAVHRMNGDLSEANRLPYFLFQRQGFLVRLTGTGTDDGLEIDLAQDSPIFALLTQAANWVKVSEDAFLHVHPPRDLARVMMAHPHRDLPWLEAVLRTPVFGRSGQLISRAGYHQQERVWLQPLGDLDLPPVPEAPSAEQVAAARSLLLDELFGDFPFVARSDAAHAVAAMILFFMRRLFRGPTPIHLIEAPRPGSGKGLLANVISVVAQGTACETKTLPGDEEEVRKLLTTELLKGHPLVLIDNADERKPIQSGALASVTTAEIWGNRQLGKLDSVRVPNLAVWLLTANNPKLVGEMARRCIRIRIDPKVDRPWRRATFRHTHLLDWARANRARLVHAVIVLVQAWLAAGRPLHRIRLGSFEAWSSAVGGILDAVGIPGFLDSLDELYDAADVEGREWRTFVTAWWEAFHGTPQKVADLTQFCEREGLMLGVRGDRSERSQQIRLGNALNSHRDQVFECYRIACAQPTRQNRGTAVYALEVVSANDAAPAPGSSGEVSGCRDVADECRDVEAKHPDTLSPIEAIAYEGVSGTSGCLSESLRKKIEISSLYTIEEREKYMEQGGPEIGSNIPTFPTSPASVSESAGWVSGCWTPNIPTAIPTHPDIPTVRSHPAIDLADFGEDT